MDWISYINFINYHNAKNVNQDKSSIVAEKLIPTFDDTTFGFDEFIGGWIGGIGGLVTSHPIDTIKVVHQNGSNSILNSIILIYKTGGLRGYYRGITVPATMAGIQNAIFFGVYANVLRELKRVSESNTEELTQIMIAGSIGGLVQVLTTAPVEIVKVRMQTSSARGTTDGVWDTLRRIIKYRGLRGFYYGFIPNILRDVPSGGLYTAIYREADDYFQKYMYSYWSHLLSGGLAGTLSYVPMTPFDVIKTRLQADSLESPHYSGLTDCVKKCYMYDGIFGFWRGFWAFSVRAFTANASIFVIYELCIDVFSKL